MARDDAAELIGGLYTVGLDLEHRDVVERERLPVAVRFHAT